MTKIFLLAAVALFLAGCGHTPGETTVQSADKIGTAALGALDKLEAGMDGIEQQAGSMANTAMEHVKDMSQPHIVIENQNVKDGAVIVTGVNLFDDGWVVIHNVVDGKPGPVVGHAPVKKGGDTHIVVPIDTARATPELIVMAHKDEGTIGTYEFPGVDAPLKVDDTVVMETFMTGADFPTMSTEEMMNDNSMDKEISMSTISKHHTKDDCWFAVHGIVYDVTPFIAKGVHPGGNAILEGCGKDATTLFETRPMGSGKPHSTKARTTLKGFKIGVLSAS